VGATSAINDTILTLDEWYKAVQAKHPKVAQGEPFFNQLNEINNNKWCINDAIKIYNNKQKVLNFAEAMILIYGAGMNCFSENSKDQTWKRLIKSLVNHYSENMIGDKKCFMLELEKFQPRSPVLLNFNSEGMDAAACEEIVDNSGFSAHIRDMESKFGSLNELTCGAVSEESLKKFLLTVVVLSSKKVQDYTNLVNEAKQMLDDAYTCVKQRMISRGNQLTKPTVATTKAPQESKSSTNNNSRNSDNQGSSDITRKLTEEKAYFYDRYYDVFEGDGKKWIYTNRWIHLKYY